MLNKTQGAKMDNTSKAERINIDRARQAVRLLKQHQLKHCDTIYSIDIDSLKIPLETKSEEEFVDEEFLHIEEQIICCIEEYRNFIKTNHKVGHTIYSDKEEAMATLEEDGLRLQFCSEDIREDPTLVQIALRTSYGCAWTFVGEKLSCTKECFEWTLDGLLAAKRQIGLVCWITIRQKEEYEWFFKKYKFFDESRFFSKIGKFCDDCYFGYEELSEKLILLNPINILSCPQWFLSSYSKKEKDTNKIAVELISTVATLNEKELEEYFLISFTGGSFYTFLREIFNVCAFCVLSNLSNETKIQHLSKKSLPFSKVLYRYFHTLFNENKKDTSFFDDLSLDAQNEIYAACELFYLPLEMLAKSMSNIYSDDEKRHLLNGPLYTAKV